MPAHRIHPKWTKLFSSAATVLAGGDATAPYPIITSAAGATVYAPFSITITFYNGLGGDVEAVTGFVVGDITVGNGTASAFVNVSDGVYTATITPTAAGAVTVDVAAGVCADAAGNWNLAATQLSRTFSFLQAGTLVVDGDMEAANVTAWTANPANTILTKETGTPHSGLRVLRATYGGTVRPAAQQGGLTVGVSYRVKGWARGDGVSAVPAVRDANGVNIWTGTASATWQAFNEVWTMQATSIFYRMNNSDSTAYVEFDDISVAPA